MAKGAAGFRWGKVPDLARSARPKRLPQGIESSENNYIAEIKEKGRGSQLPNARKGRSWSRQIEQFAER